MLRAYGYVRVSSVGQEDGASLASQEEAIKKFALTKGLTLMGIYKETFSGFYLRERKVLNELRTKIRANEFDVLIVNSLDRWSREQIHQAVLLHELMEHKITLESVTERLDQSAVGTFMRQAIGFAAEIEREKILERGARGKKARTDRGVLVGVGTSKYGYEYAGEKNSTYTINPEQAAIVRRIYDMYVGGFSSRKIADILTSEQISSPKNGRQWYPPTVMNILRDSFYKGVAYANIERTLMVDGKRKRVPNEYPVLLPEGTVPAIVNIEVWQAANAKRATAQAEAPRKNPDITASLLRSGIAVCGHCGKNMIARRRHKGEVLDYTCSSYFNPGRKCIGATIATKRLDSEVWEFVADILGNLEYIRSVIQENPGVVVDDADALNKLEAAALSEQDQLVEDLKSVRGRARELILTEINRLEDKITNIRAEVESIKPAAEAESNIKAAVDRFFDWCASVRDLSTLTYEEKRFILKFLGISVKVWKLGGEERYRIEMKPNLMDYKSITNSTTCYAIRYGELRIARTPAQRWIWQDSPEIPVIPLTASQNPLR